MDDLNLTDFLLNLMTAYGPGVLGSALLLGGAGVPIPAMLLVLCSTHQSDCRCNGYDFG